MPFDPRIVFIETFKACCDKLNLDAFASGQYEHPDKIDLVEVARSSSKFQVLVNRYHYDGASADQAMGYIFSDTLVLQVSVSKTGTYKLSSALNELRDMLFPLMAEIIKLGRKGVWGCSFLFWALTDVERLSQLDGPMVTNAITDSQEFAHGEVEVVIGKLFEVNTAWFDDVKILLTPSSQEMEKRANESLFYRSDRAPADFPLMEMARHKFHWEYLEYVEAKEELERIGKSIDRRLNWLIDTQHAYGDRLSVANSREAEEFIQKLSKTLTNYSDFAQSITRVKDLRNTLQVNHAIFEEKASAFLLKGGRDSVFAPQLSQMNTVAKQLDIDCEYYGQAQERAETVLESAQRRLDLLRGREGAETVRLQGIQASALASVAVTALILQLVFMIPEFQANSLLAVSFMSMVAVGTFALSQILINWNRVHTKVGRLAFSVTLGFTVSTLVIWRLGPVATMQSIPWIVFSFFVCTLIGYFVFKYFEEMSNRRRAEELNRLVGEVTGIKKLNYAIEELPDLLEDLPITRLWRIKDEKSLLEKLVRKGPGYTIRDVTDAIGIRYVVSPWELPKIVERVKQVVDVEKIEYRNDRITSKVNAEGKKVFQPGYKSVHIDADLWGVGAKRDINLIAEIQVRTRLQDIYANFCHDRLYKPKSGKQPAGLKMLLVKIAVHLLEWTSDLELFLFGRWMGWKTTQNNKKELENASAGGKSEAE